MHPFLQLSLKWRRVSSNISTKLLKKLAEDEDCDVAKDAQGELQSREK